MQDGHTIEKCRCDIKCYVRSQDSRQVYIALAANNHKIQSWIAYINGDKVTVALDSCAETSIMSKITVDRLGLDKQTTNRIGHRSKNSLLWHNRTTNSRIAR